MAGQQSMDRLPDEVLLEVLRFLRLRDLLTCRLVCKRFDGLVRHPDAWRHRKFYRIRCVCPVLRLAPRVRLLNIGSRWDRPPVFVRQCARRSQSVPRSIPCRAAAFASTSCAAEELRLSLTRGKDRDTAAHAAAAVNRQVVLGRLRRVDLYIPIWSSIDASVIPPVLSALAAMPRLDELVVRGSGPIPPAFLSSAALPPSLRQFTVKTFSLESERFVMYMLAKHAATLERVLLGHDPTSVECTSTVRLLPDIPNLRTLTCCTIPGLEAVAACRSLRVLGLTVSDDARHRDAAAELLRRAVHLREVRLVYLLTTGDADVDIDADLLMALASVRSRVRSLTVVCIPAERNPIRRHRQRLSKRFMPLQALASALPSLPALRRLRIPVKPAHEDAFRALIMAEKPSLKLEFT